MNREDGTNGDVNVDIGGPIERIEEHHVWPTGIARRWQDRLRSFLRGHGTDVPARFERLNERLMRKDVKFRDLLALDVLLARKPENIHQSRFIHLAGNDLRSQGDLRQQAGEIPRRSWIVPLLFHDMSAQGNA